MAGSEHTLDRRGQTDVGFTFCLFFVSPHV